jgi:uncharacterized membrane-anchored protein YitT (DUF2179 family)
MSGVHTTNTKIHWSSIYTFQTFVQLILGVGLTVFALKGFMIPNHFLDGGVIGISLLSHELFHFNLSMCLIIGNLGFLVLAYRQVSKEVAIRSFIAVVLLAIGLELVHINEITSDKLLISIFGGVILGTGAGLVIRSGGAVDGTEILVVLTRRRIGLSMSEVLIIINTTIFLIAAIKFGIETAMFSIITYFAAAKMIDYVVDGVEQFNTLTIISGKSDLIKEIIINYFQKGITVYKGERGYLPGMINNHKDCDIIVTVVTRLELLNIKNAIASADPEAFMFVQNIKEASGGILKRQSRH